MDKYVSGKICCILVVTFELKLKTDSQTLLQNKFRPALTYEELKQKFLIKTS